MPLPRRQRDQDADFKEWRWATLTDLASVKGAGSLLLLATLAVFLAALGVTIFILYRAGVIFESKRWIALMLGGPSIILAVIAYFALAPVFFRLHQRWTEDD